MITYPQVITNDNNECTNDICSQHTGEVWNIDDVWIVPCVNCP